MGRLKLGLQLGYWGAQPPDDLLGTERIRDRLRAWNDPPVTTILVMSHDLSFIRSAADLVLG